MHFNNTQSEQASEACAANTFNRVEQVRTAEKSNSRSLCLPPRSLIHTHTHTIHSAPRMLIKRG